MGEDATSACDETAPLKAKSPTEQRAEYGTLVPEYCHFDPRPLGERWRLRLFFLLVTGTIGGALYALQLFGTLVIVGFTAIRSMLMTHGIISCTYCSHRDLTALVVDDGAAPPESEAAAPVWHHIFIVPTYREKPEATRAVLRSLAAQRGATERLIVVVSYEEESPGAADAARHVAEFGSNCFEALLVTTHARGVVGEVPGRGSNFKHASAHLLQHLQQEGKTVDRYTLTVGDGDVLYDTRHVAAFDAELRALGVARAHRTLWQAPMIYGVAERTQLVRGVAMLRTAAFSLFPSLQLSRKSWT